MNKEEKPTPSFEGKVCGALLYWITLIGTVVAIAGMVIGFTTDNNFNQPSNWISSIWDGRNTENTWQTKAITGIDGGIRYVEVSEHGIICNTEADQSGTEYILKLSDGKLKETLDDDVEPQYKPEQGASDQLSVEYSGADFTIKDSAGNVLGEGSVSTDTSPYGPAGEYSIITYAIGNIDDDPDSEVVFLANENDSYPGQVYMVDADGSLINRYWSPGNVYTLNLYDITDDDNLEILVGATNRDIMFEDISTPAIYALDPPMDDTELEASPYSGDIGEGEEEWASFPDLEHPPLSHWYLSHLGDGDGLATFGLAIGVSSVILALFVPALLCLRRKAIFFGMLALVAAIITLISMFGLLPLPD